MATISLHPKEVMSLADRKIQNINIHLGVLEAQHADETRPKREKGTFLYWLLGNGVGTWDGYLTAVEIHHTKERRSWVQDMKRLALKAQETNTTVILTEYDLRRLQ